MLYTVDVCAPGWSPVRCVRRGGVGVGWGMGWASVGEVVQDFGTFLSVFVYAPTEESCEIRQNRLERGCVIEKAACVLMRV